MVLHCYVQVWGGRPRPPPLKLILTVKDRNTWDMKRSTSKAAGEGARPTHSSGFRIAAMRPVFEWQIGSRAVRLGKRTLIMGVVNVTPDSFSDGGVNFDRDRAVEYALKLLHDGADIIDVGGESTRPGANVVSEGDAVTEKEELERVIPVISAVKQQECPGDCLRGYLQGRCGACRRESRGGDRQRCQRISVGPANEEDAGGIEVWGRADAYAWASPGMEDVAAANGRGDSGQTRTAGAF